MEKFRPLKDRVLVLPVQTESRTPSGLHIPDNAKEASVKGRVIAAGPEAEGVSVGDMVMYGKYAGVEITIVDGEDRERRLHKVMPITEIIAVIET